MSRASERPTAVTDPDDLLTSFAEAMQRLGIKPPVALAVSGGGDSMALLHLAVSVFASENILVLTVDHGLRADSRDDAAFVLREAAALGLRGEALAWEGEKPTSRIQERARAARYDLLTAACRKAGITSLLVAHTLEDQLETVGMRALRGSGTMGLAGMSVATDLSDGVTLYRPLLEMRREDLRDFLRARGADWREDPSNENTSFERVRMREVLSEQGEAHDRLVSIVDSASSARTEMEAASEALVGDAVALAPAGWARVDLSVWRAAPLSLQETTLARLLQALGGQAYPPERQAVSRLNSALAEGGSLGGCTVTPAREGTVLLGREARNQSAVEIAPGESHLWDGRIRITNHGASAVMARPLGSDGLQTLSTAQREQVKAAFPPAFRASALCLVGAAGVEIPVCCGRLSAMEVRFRAAELLKSAQILKL